MEASDASIAKIYQPLYDKLTSNNSPVAATP